MKNNLPLLKSNIFNDTLNSGVVSETLGRSIVTITGRTEVYIEHHNGVTEYETETVTVSSSGATGDKGTIRITGKNLTIKSMNSESLAVTGVIDTVTFGM
jgi:sporulation protein YqfC